MHLTKEQLLAFLGEAKKHSECHWLLFALCYLHGLRISEALDLTAANIRDGFITVKRLKGSLKTTQALIEHEHELLNEKPALERMCSKLKPTDRIFKFGSGKGEWRRTQSWRLMKRYGSLAGIPDHLLHPHILKHTCGMAAIPRGIEYTQRYLGHRSLASTGAYIRKTDEEACAAIQKFL